MSFLLITSVLAFYVAWNLGANDVANSMGTSVGSKAVTLRQALVIAGILEFTGAVLFGDRVSATLATDIVNPQLFAADPSRLMLGMISALVACGVWLQIATSLGLPVASSHAIVGALAGFGWVAIGLKSVHWHLLLLISLTWIVTPVVSGSIAALLYRLVDRWILQSQHSLQQLYEWIPWLSAALVGAFGYIVLPAILTPERLRAIPIPQHDVLLAVGAIAISGLTWSNWQYLQKMQNGGNSQWRLKSLLSEATEPSEATEFPDRAIIESVMARFQLLSACFVAFAHGSNDVGNAVAPLAAIAYIHRTHAVPVGNFVIPTWILILGAIGIVSGLAVFGKNVIQTIGEGIIALQPSGGFCAELATAMTILIASRLGLPVSTSHALVGAVVGIGLVQSLSTQQKSNFIQVNTVQQIGFAWIVTIPIAAGLSALIFAVMRSLHSA